MDEAFDILMSLISLIEMDDSSKSHFGSLVEGIHEGGLGEGLHDDGLGEGIHDDGLSEVHHDGSLGEGIHDVVWHEI